MVFESLVADLLNRFLGDFVDNLDASQLNIGIWGGDVKLDNLEVKETALDDLDLPVKLKFGYLSNLVLKIPWKSLYTEPVIATIEGLHLIVVPNKGVVFNKEKANKNEQDVKQKALLRLEENRIKRRKPPDPAADSFAEKMVAQVIKNLQVTIKSIHIRYEDKYTNRHRPFVAGATLEGLNFMTTDENWVETIHKEAVQVVYKLVSLNSLALYWNPDSPLISDLSDKDDMKRQMQEGIATSVSKPPGYKYVLEPIQMQAKLSMNQKPETDGTDWKRPKMQLEVDMERLALCVGKLQYQDVLLFLEAQERFTTAGRYLQYRPPLNEYHGYYSQWWHFAHKSILEENIRRKKKNWSWDRMRTHRHLVRAYKDAWLNKLTEKTLSSEHTDVITRAEETLDVFNLNIARQQADMEIDRRGLMRLEDQPQGWVNWAKSWWSGGEQHETHKQSASDIVSQFEEAMTPEEKAKLFEAIDYQENTPPTDYPPHFVENVVSVQLKSLMVVVESALSLTFSLLTASVKQRPSARAINIVSGIKSVSMEGCGQPMLSMVDETVQWLQMEVDTNPLNRQQANYDQLVRLRIAATLLKYHAPAINTAIDALKPPESVRLNQLTAAAMTRYEDVKTRSVTGLAHAVETKSKLVLDMCIEPATVVISQSGVFDEQQAALVTDLGTLTITTVDDDTSVEHSKDADVRRQELMNQAYDKFAIKLTNVQLILANDYHLAMGARADASSTLHVLRPTGMAILIHKASIDDLQLPKMRVLGDLPDVVVTLSDERVLQLTKLALSIPTPPPDPEVEQLAHITSQADWERGKLKDRAKMRAIMEVDELSDQEAVITEEKPVEKEHEQQVQLEMRLNLNQVGVVIGTKDAVLLSVQVRRMGCTLEMRTFDMRLTATLGHLTVEQPQFKSLLPNRESLFLIDSTHDQGDHLLQLSFVQANPESPFFATEYHSTEQAVTITFKTLSMSLHQEALMSLKAFGESLQAKMDEVQRDNNQQTSHLLVHVDTQKRRLSRKLSQLSLSSLTATTAASATSVSSLKESRRLRAMREEDKKGNRNIKMHLDASFEALSLLIGSNTCLDTSLSITTIRASLRMKLNKMTLHAGLHAISMTDCTGSTAHKHLLAVCGTHEMFTLQFVQFNRTDEEKARMSASDLDMAVKCRFAQMRFVFLNVWLCRLMKWLEPFQAEAALAAAQAQALATEKASEAAQKAKQLMEQSPPKVQLDVELQAPTIIVPQKSTSLDALVFDLGKLSISNKFSSVSEEPRAVIDNMQIMLSDVNFAIGRLCSEPSAELVSAKCQILEPLSFQLSLYRNLCFSWYKLKPELLVNAQLPTIRLNVSQEDYATMMNTLSGNLAEGGDDKPAPAPVTRTTSTKPKDDKTTDKTAPSSPATPPATHSAAQRVVFSFKMDHVAIQLFSGSSNLKDEKGIVRRDPEAAFASLRLMLLKLSGALGEDSSMDVALSLGTFTMDDERKGATRITRLLDKKPDKSDNELSQFVGMRFEQNASSDKKVNLSTSAFFLCLCPEFLGALASFFSVPPSEEDDIKAETPVTRTTSVTNAKPAAVSDTPAGTLTMNCKMREVEVVLIEDANKPLQTQALILSFNVDLDAQHEDGKQHMKGGVKNLQMISSYYAPELRGNSPYHVLNRVDIAFEGTIEDSSKSQLFDVSIGQMHLKVSPSVIRLLSAVSASFSAANQPKTGAEKKRKPILKKYPHYWDKKKVQRNKHWWFSVADEVEEEYEDGLDVVAALDHREEAKIKMPSLMITLEAGLGEVTAPMILVESHFNGLASDWSALLSVDADVSLQVSYYNETYSVWEPVLEPVESDGGVWKSWNLSLEMRSHSEEELCNEGCLPPPVTTIEIRASDLLNVTVTKLFLSLLTQLSDSFEKAAKQISPPSSRQLPGISPYLILNNTGIAVKVANSLTTSAFTNATSGSFVDLDIPVAHQGRIGLSSQSGRVNLRLVFDEMHTEREINIMRAEIRVIALPRVSDGKQWKMVTETKLENSRRLVVLRSAVQVVNHMESAFEVHSLRDTMLDMCGVVEPGADPLDIPLPLLYTPTGQLYLRPVPDRYVLCSYDMSNESVCCYQLADKARQVLRCDVSETNDTTKCFYVSIVVQRIAVKAERSTDLLEHVYVLHLYPTLTVNNLMPCALRLVQPIECTVAGGEEVALNVVPGSEISMEMTYRSQTYLAQMTFPASPPDLDVLTLTCGDKQLNVGVHWSTEHRRLLAQIYAPYWLVNNTGKTLKYIESNASALTRSASCVSCHKGSFSNKSDVTVVHEAFDKPALLPFSAQHFLNKKKAKVQMEGAEWSDEFPLDAVGNAGRITCKSNNYDMEMTLDVRLCQSGLTKVVCFSPFYLINNVSQFPIDVKEHGLDEWTTVQPETCVGMWPQQKANRKLLIVRYTGTEEESVMFPFTENFEGFCHIDNEYLGVSATCSLGESSSVIRIEPFEPGMAPALLMNATDQEVQFAQKGSRSMQSLQAWQSCMFTWTDLTRDRELHWKTGAASNTDGLFMNAFNSYACAESSDVQYYWVSFLNGRQRVVLFTDDLAVMTMAHEAYEVERISQQIEISLQGIGLSLVNNLTAQEVLFMGIASSAIIWEQLVKSRYKLLTVKQMEAVEKAYQNWLSDPTEKGVLVEKLDIDFNSMKLKKKRGETDIRRQFQTGLWMQYRQSAHQTQMHVKVNHLQVDNQLSACVFPCVLSVVAPPKSVTADNAPKPFMELSFTMRQSEHSNVVQIKYLHLLVQELAVEVDQGLLNALLELLATQTDSKPYTKEAFEQDEQLTMNQLSQLAVSTTSSQQKAFYDDLHISPLMIHLSFSQGGSSASNEAAMPIQSEFVSVLLKSVGVSVTELQDVVFKLAFFERKFAFYNREQLQAEVVSHYTKQAIKQLYVLVLGLDIIGNPFGLVRDLSTGVEDFFYQPFQGAIQGPEEFAEGVALGVKSLFGATVGGATGAVSRITGTLGKGVAALTLDQDYQRKRQQAINRRPQNFGEGMARGAKGVGQGLYEGITGVVSKPLEGARSGGVGGFAKGLGKGLVGAVVRPVSGVVDFASSSLVAVKTVTTGSEETKPLRPARVIFADNIVRPYSQKLALGAKIFKEADRGAIADTDQFVAHAPISDRCVFIVTEKRVMLVKRSDMVGSWNVDWHILFSEMKQPQVIDNGIRIELKTRHRGFLGLGSSTGKVVQFHNAEVAMEMKAKLQCAYDGQMEDV